MGQLSALADSIEATFGLRLGTVSGGNSANLGWVLSGADPGRIDDLRLGEALLLGREPLSRERIPGLYPDAITLVAEVIESKRKPAQPWGTIGHTPFGERRGIAGTGDIQQAILAIGEQDADTTGLRPPDGLEILGASGDHLLVNCLDVLLSVGDTVRFKLDYRALQRSMSSPFVARWYQSDAPAATGAPMPVPSTVEPIAWDVSSG